MEKGYSRGFTLIELLAVILILGIIALIAIPSVSTLTEQSRRGSFELSANNLVDAVKDRCSSSFITGTFQPGTYNIVDGKLDERLDVKFSGKLPKNGKIIVNNKCEIAIDAEDSNNLFRAVKLFTDERVTVLKIGESSSKIDDFNTIPISEEGERSCFLYENNSEGVTITGYKFDDNSCSRDIVIPAKIDGKNVTKLKELAFVDKDRFALLYKSYYPSAYEGELTEGASLVDLHNLPNISGDSSYLYSLLTYDKGTRVTKTTCYIGDESTVIEGTYTKTDSDGYDFCLYSITTADSTPSNNQINSLDFSNNPYITEIPYALAIDTEIKSLNLGSTITKIGAEAFGYGKLTSLTLPDSVVEIDSRAFAGNKITSLNTNNVETINAMAFISNMIDDLNLVKVKHIGSKAFNNNALNAVVTPSTLEVIGFLGFAYNNLQSVDLRGNHLKVGVGAFAPNDYTATITSLTLRDGVEELYTEAFAYTNITSLTTPSSLKKIGDGAFHSSTLLQTVTLNSGLKEIGQYAFQNDDIKSIKIPNSVTTLGEGAFYQNKNLASLTLGTGLTVIPKYAFYLTAIRKLTIPSNIKRVEESGLRCRYNSITSLTFSEGLEYIGKNAFNKTINIATITLPNSVKEIASSAFMDNANIKTINIGPNVTKIGSNAFKNLTSLTVNINRPEGSVTGAPWGATDTTVNWAS